MKSRQKESRECRLPSFSILVANEMWLDDDHDDVKITLELTGSSKEVTRQSAGKNVLQGKPGESYGEPGQLLLPAVLGRASSQQDSASISLLLNRSLGLKAPNCLACAASTDEGSSQVDCLHQSRGPAGAPQGSLAQSWGGFCSLWLLGWSVSS